MRVQSFPAVRTAQIEKLRCPVLRQMARAQKARVVAADGHRFDIQAYPFGSGPWGQMVVEVQSLDEDCDVGFAHIWDLSWGSLDFINQDHYALRVEDRFKDAYRGLGNTVVSSVLSLCWLSGQDRFFGYKYRPAFGFYLKYGFLPEGDALVLDLLPENIKPVEVTLKGAS